MLSRHLGRLGPRRISPSRSKSVSFAPTSSLYDFETQLLSHEEDEAAIPDPPSFTQTPKLFSDMVRPSDVCDLVMRPTFTDVVVTALAKNCSVAANDTYAVVSRSSIRGTDLRFANVAASWLDEVNHNILDLAPLPKDDRVLTYNNGPKSKLVANQFSPEVTESYESLELFYKFFVDTPEKNVTIETVTQYLLTQVNDHHYQWVVEYLTQNVDMLNPFVLNDFVAVLLQDLVASASVEKVELFDTFLNESLLKASPQLLEELPPATLDQLAYITASSSNLQTANKALALLCQNYRLVAAPATFDLFVARYSKLANQQNFSREQVLRDLSPLKPVFFHYGLSPNSLKLLLHHVVDSVFELSHLVQLVREKSPRLFAQFGGDLLDRLDQLQRKTGHSELVKRVQRANLEREISQRNSTGN